MKSIREMAVGKTPAPGQESQLRLLVRVTEAAEMCGISRSLAYGLVASGTWPSVRFGRAVRVPLGALNRWIEENAA
jgi:excisionase family DNA binding protein